MIEFDANGLYQGMTRSEFHAVNELIATMYGEWLYSLTARDQDAVQRAQQRLEQETAGFRSFTPAQQTYFLRKYHCQPADLPTALAILVALGLAQAI